MNASLRNNAENSASTPSNELPRSEHELLKLRESTAKAALRNTAKDLGRNLLGLLDPRKTVQEHPWKSSGVAVLAGFLVALKVVPPSSSEGEAPRAGPSKAAGTSPWETLTSTLVETGSGAVKAALLPWLAQKIQDWMPKKEPATSEDEAKPEEVPFAP